MKKFILFAAAALLLSACQMTSFEEEEPGTNPAKGEKTMHFKLSAYQMSNMDELSQNDGSMHAPMYAAPQNATDHLLLAIYDIKGNLVDTIAYQDKNDPKLAEYGKFSHSLKYGKYTVLAIGWDGSQKCIVHRQDSISFSENWTPHTFLCRKNIVVSESYSDTRALKMKRCVAKFSMWLKNKGIPVDTRDIMINISGGSCNLNSETGYSAEVNNVTRNLMMPADPSNVTHISVYSFLPTDSTGLTIKVTAHAKDGSVMKERTFTDVPMKINHWTSYRGNFFSATVDNSIVFDDAYAGNIDREF